MTTPDETPKIEIYLTTHGNHIPFLSIPHSDIERLSLRPFKWMRFVMFSICGVEGDLSATPDGPSVDYESILLDEDRYYYKSSEQFAFVDPDGLNDRITSSARTPRRSAFGQGLKDRDESCIFTGETSQIEAAHLIPLCKGDEYIARVTERRAQAYNYTQVPRISDINAIENGMLLDKNLHGRFGDKEVAFLKTPNFAMDSSDIPRVERRTEGDQITLQQFWKYKNPGHPEEAEQDERAAQQLRAQTAAGNPPRPRIAVAAGLNIDALFSGPRNADHRPPAIILDFTYGVAAYSQWRKGPVHDVVQGYFEKNYHSISPLPRAHGSDFDDTDASAGPSDGSEYVPPKGRSSKKRAPTIDAMDQMNLVMMYLSGITPQMYHKQKEEEELRAQEAGRDKVMEWRNTVDFV